jgi:alanine-glyoxylate transaminase/serine-glyoxylate transaminase/serine-pyruvate transaminase
MELTLLPEPALAANTLSAVRYPSGIDAALVGAIAAQGVVVAGGLHPSCKAEYFRVGHMGAISPSDVLAVVGAIERAFAALGQRRHGLAAAQAALA